MAQYINDPVPKYRSDDLNKTVKDLRNYTVGLTDQLQYLLANLDEDNIPELEAIKKRLTDTEGNVTNLDLSANGLKLTVQDHENRLASLSVTVGGIETSVSDMDGNLSQLTQTVNGIGTRVTDAEGNISTLQQTAGGLSTRVADAEGNITDLQQTSEGLFAQVAGNKSELATLKITSSGLESTVSDLNGKYTSLRQDVDSIDITGMVTFDALDTELADYPTKKSLSRGTTSIDGGCIDTGLIDVDFIELYGEMEVLKRRGGASGGFIGYCEGNSDTGVGVMEDYDTGQCICTNGGAKLAYGADDFYIGVSRSNIFASEDIYIESDRRVKEDIRYDLEGYEGFYRLLKPCSFLRKRGTSGRRHTGFIAQELEEALSVSGKTTMDLAALGYDPEARRYESNGQTPETVEKGCWKIRYTELVALNTAMIQKLMRRVDELEKIIEALRGGNADGV